MKGVASLLLAAGIGGACVADPEPRPLAPPPLAAPALGLSGAPPPGAEHRSLDVLVGTWQVELFAAAGGEPIARGKAEVRWCLAGRFLGFDLSFEIAGGGRSPASGFLGYDARAGEYQWVWASGWSGRASLARGRGELDAGGLRLVSLETDPSTGAKARVRSILRLRGPDELEIEQAVESGSGAWQPTTLTIYRRAAPDEGPAGASSAPGASSPARARAGSSAGL